MVRWLRSVARLSGDRHGSVTVITAVGLAALIGVAALGTDVGRLYLARQRASSAADAAALSGAQFLPQDRQGALNAVQTYLVKNGITASEATVTVNDVARTMAVSVQQTVPLTFARFLGQESGKILAQATARTGNLTGYDRVAPLAVVRQDWQLGAPVVLKESPGTDGTITPGNYGGLALGGTGANTYEQNLQEGYPGWIRVGDTVETKTGDMAEPTQRALQYRISQDPQASYLTVRKGSPRILIIPVVDAFYGQGRSQLRVAGFAAFFVESVATEGNDKGTVRGRFIRYVVAGESNGDGGDFATYTIKLTH